MHRRFYRSGLMLIFRDATSVPQMRIIGVPHEQRNDARRDKMEEDQVRSNITKEESTRRPTQNWH